MKFRPLHDRVVVRRIEEDKKTAGGIIIPDTVKEKPMQGEVIAVGPGRYPIKYNGRKGVRTKSWLGKHFIPTEIKVGDIVELGGLQLGDNQFRGYNFQTFLWGTKEYLICREGDVAGIVDEH